MYVIIKAVSIHLKINIIMKSKSVRQKLLVGNEGIKVTKKVHKQVQEKIRNFPYE